MNHAVMTLVALRETGARERRRVGKVHTGGSFGKDPTVGETRQCTETNWKRVEASMSSMIRQEKRKIVGCGIQNHVK